MLITTTENAFGRSTVPRIGELLVVMEIIPISAIQLLSSTIDTDLAEVNAHWL